MKENVTDTIFILLGILIIILSYYIIILPRIVKKQINQDNQKANSKTKRKVNSLTTSHTDT